MIKKENPKKRLFEILLKGKRDIFFINKKIINNKQLVLDLEKIIFYLNKFKKIKLIELNLSNKYFFTLILLGALFTNKTVYPSTNTTRIFKDSMMVDNEENIKKIINTKVIKNIKFNFKNSKFLFLETTGTTSKKKMIIFNSFDYLNACIHSKNIFKYSIKNKILHCLPIYYNAGLNNILFAPLFGRSKIVFSENFTIFNLSKIFKTANLNKCNSIQLMPSMFMNLIFFLKNKKFVKSFISIISTGSFLYPEIKNKFFNKFKKTIYSCYGITELGGAICVESKSSKNLAIGSVGIISSKIRIELNKKMEINLNTPFQMSGYLIGNKFKKLGKNFLFNTGDTGYMLKNNLFLTGRTKEIVKRGGENISLKKIENVAIKYNKIKNAICISKKNIYSDEDIIMLIETGKNFTNISKKKFNLHLENNLDKNFMPHKIIFKNKFSYFSNGKLNRQQLLNSMVDF